LNSANPLPRYALYGGAFDPPHNAHVNLVRQLLAQLDVERVWVVPTGQAWHKARPLTSATHRLAMTRLAFAELPHVVVDDREMRRPGPSYTVQTLEELRSEQPQGDWFLLMGQDQWASFSTWKSWEQILRIATPVVAERSMKESVKVEKNIKIESRPADSLQVELPQPIHLTWTPQPISSTALRQNPSDASALLPQAVARYISEHSLYNSPP
jgi:nicotinate-nucleotide adenylyltransferase